ncbi:MAG: helix-turn-helix domain-containing protein [Patescibacteria group bacterium]
MFEKELVSLGLSEKEAKVYMAVLELGPETVQNIAKKADINRPTTYLQIESLKERGLMSQFEKGKKTFFVAESPEQLSRIVSAMESDLNVKKTQAERMIPALKDIFEGAGERPKVRFLEGQEGAKTLQADFLSVKDKSIESFSNLDSMFEVFPNHEKDYSQKRIEKGIKNRVIYTRKDGPLPGATDPSKLREAKYVSAERMPISADVTIYDNKVALVTYRVKPIGVVIESQEIASMFRVIFNLLWNDVAEG